MRQAPQAKPGPGEIVVRVYACSLNYHDYAVVTGENCADDGRVLMSDGAGEVVETGRDTTFTVGDRVISTFFPDWIDGAASLDNTRAITGDRVDGYASSYVTKPQSWFTRAPRSYTHREAATLPCAAPTAWRALVVEGGVKAGDIVLVQGSGRSLVLGAPDSIVNCISTIEQIH